MCKLFVREFVSYVSNQYIYIYHESINSYSVPLRYSRHILLLLMNFIESSSCDEIDRNWTIFQYISCVSVKEHPPPPQKKIINMID